MHLKFFLGILVVLAAVTGSGCSAAGNPLLGTWVWDTEKTFHELKVPAEGSDEIKKSAMEAKAWADAVRKSIGQGTTVTYKDNEFVQVIRSEGVVLSEQSAPYSVVNVSEDQRVVDVRTNAGIISCVLEGNSFYVETEFKGYKYRSYWTKVP